MTRRIKKREFDPSQPVFINKPLRDSGVLLPEGTPFDWKRSSLSVRRVANLFNAGYLRHEQVIDPLSQAEIDEATAPSEPSAPTEATEATAPSEPSAPTEATEATAPSEPSAPTEATEATEATAPSAPTNPTEPKIPDKTAKK
jgi:hypothetical protein